MPDDKPKITLVLDNLRSCHNVGSILRTANGLGVQDIIYIGTTPYPELDNDTRLPHLVKRQTSQIAKTALGAERMLNGAYFSDASEFLAQKEGLLVCLEQTNGSSPLTSYALTEPIYLALGNEVSGVSEQLIESADTCIEIPMKGAKESFNVAVSAGIAIHQILVS